MHRAVKVKFTCSGAIVSLVVMALAGSPARAEAGQTAPQKAVPAKPAPPKPATAGPAAAPAGQKVAPKEQKGLLLSKILGDWTGDLDGMIERRFIRVATTYNRTHYFIDKGMQRGAVYEAFKLFENELNAKLKPKGKSISVVFVPMSRDELLSSLVTGRADIAAAALTITPERQKLVDFSMPTRTDVSEIVVTGPGAPAIKSADDLAGQEVFVRKSSSFFESLAALNAKLKGAGKKEVVIKEAPESLETDDVLEMVNAGLVKITVADDHIAEFWKQLLPNLMLHPDVAVRTGGALAPAMRKNSPKFMAAVNEWIKKHGQRTMFGNMMTQRYLKNTKFAKSATGAAELKRFEEMIEFFRKYGEKYGLDTLLVAAQGYQESGLDHSVKSRVGAIGVMQVMPATGKELGVGDIKDVENNIHAGAKYMRFMIDTYYAKEPMDMLNKGLFAFASYNAGPARIRQLRREAENLGLNPNVWFDNVERIASERIGRETVTYVSNIFKYYVAYRLALDELDARRKLKEKVPS